MCVCLYAENRFSSREHTVPFLFFLLLLFFCRFSQKTHALSHVHVTLGEFSFFFSLRFAVGCLNLFSLRSLFFWFADYSPTHRAEKNPKKNRVSKKLVAASSHVRRILRRVKPRIVGSIPGGRGWDTGLFYVVYSEKIIRITTEKHSDDSSDEKRVWCTTTEFVCAGVASARFATFWSAVLFRVRARSRARQKKSKIFTRAAHLDHHFRVAPKALREIHLTIAHNEQKQPSRPVNPQTVTRALVLFFARTLYSRENVF